LFAAISSFLSLLSGGGLKASLLWGNKAQKIGGSVVALLIVGLARWLAEGFSVWLFGSHLSGDLWCWIGFAIGLVFTSSKRHGEAICRFKDGMLPSDFFGRNVVLSF
jgi:hypothetical protein